MSRGRPAKRKRKDDSSGDAPPPSDFLHMAMSLSMGWAAADSNAKRESHRVEKRKKEAAEYATKHPDVPAPVRFSVEDFRHEGEHVVWEFTDFAPPSPGFPVYQPNYRISFQRKTPADDPDTTVYGAVVHQATPRFCFTAEEKGRGLDRLLCCADGAVDIFAKPHGKEYDIIYSVRSAEKKRDSSSDSD
jgi:hypothetical protein